MASIPATPALPQHVKIAIIGAGFGGLGMAIRLRDHGQTDFLVLDQGDTVGGTWRDNTYPGAACDVPSQLYSFSFAPNPDWSRSFSPQPEIHTYLRRVAERSDVLDRFRLGTTVEEATYDEEHRVWRVRTTAGTLTCDVLVGASGGLSEPKLPDIAGIDDFEGEVFHSARWNHDYDLSGKRVAVIGTGASAIQIVPEVARDAAQLDVYQRTAPWVIPRNDRAYTRIERIGFRALPALQRLYRTAIYWSRECYVPAFTWRPALAAPARLAAEANIRKGISDPQLRRRVTPDYQIGCKRILISNTYYPALARDNVELVTDPIRSITRSGIVTADGTQRPVDALIVATGFHATDHPIAQHIVGRHAQTLAQAWASEGQAAYKGTTIHGFPNFFQIVGPNTGLGHTSMVFMIESQIAYILSAIATIDAEQLAAVEPTVEAQRAWNADLQRRMGRTVWSSGGCASWYLDDQGRNTTLWPRTTVTFRRQLAHFDQAAYDVVVRGGADSSPNDPARPPAHPTSEEQLREVS